MQFKINRVYICFTIRGTLQYCKWWTTVELGHWLNDFWIAKLRINNTYSSEKWLTYGRARKSPNKEYPQCLAHLVLKVFKGQTIFNKTWKNHPQGFAGWLLMFPLPSWKSYEAWHCYKLQEIINHHLHSIQTWPLQRNYKTFGLLNTWISHLTMT